MHRLFPFLFLPLLAACEQLVIGPVGEAPPPPATVTSTSLDGRVALAWSDESYQWNPARFRLYRVWSAAYDLDRDLCHSRGRWKAPRWRRRSWWAPWSMATRAASG